MQVFRVAFSPDSRLLAVNGWPKGNGPEFTDSSDPRDLPQPKIILFDLAKGSGEPEVVICPQGHAGGLAFGPDGKTLAVGGAGAVHLFDMTDKKP
jgi:WD40 repeat protein